jgi:membrane-associated protease RseP (regulator of RpoE activity)
MKSLSCASFSSGRPGSAYAIAASMRLRVLAGLLSVALSGSIALAGDAPPAESAPPSVSADNAAPAPAPAPVAKPDVRLRVVKVMADTQEALLLDKATNKHVLVEVGAKIGNYTVMSIEDDEVTLASGRSSLVLSAPEHWHRPARGAKSVAASGSSVAENGSSVNGTGPNIEIGPTANIDIAPGANISIGTADDSTAGSLDGTAGDSADAPVDPYADAAPTVAASPTGPAFTAAAPASAPAPTAARTATAATPIIAGDDGVRIATSAPTTIGSADPYADGPELVTAAPNAPAAPAMNAPAMNAPAMNAPTTIAPATAPAITAVPGSPTTAPAAPVVTPTVLMHSELNATLSDFSKLTASVQGEFTPQGVRLDRIADGSLFAHAGLKVGDTVVAVDNTPLHSLDDAADLYARAGQTRAANISILRAGKPMTLRVLFN